MFFAWRPSLIRAFAPAALGLGLACALPAGPALALEQQELKELERLLRDLGFDPGPVDGVVDDATTDAIRRYHDFALLPGDPAPSARLLGELRGVAAAFAALNADQEKAAPPVELPDLGTTEPEVTPETVSEKVVMPPPPPPPKLKPPEEAEEPETKEPQAGEKTRQVAALPPPATEEPASEAAPPLGSEAAPVDDTPARIDAELAPYRKQLADGSLSREALARQFNDEGRKLLQQALYDEAILKFTVSIHLDPNFAGAYSNRGTAYQHQEESELAKVDFDKAKTLGFGGLRLRSDENPLK